MSPYISVAIFTLAFIIKAVYLGDLSGFMVSSEESDMCWVACFEGDEKGEDFQGIVTSVNEITHEDVVCVWDFSTCFEEF